MARAMDETRRRLVDVSCVSSPERVELALELSGIVSSYQTWQILFVNNAV